jgi:hypothetical protein
MPALFRVWISLSLAVPVISLIPDVYGGSPIVGIPVAG